METLAEKYILLDSLLFKIVTTPEKETALLAIHLKYMQTKLLHSIIQVYLQDTKVLLTPTSQLMTNSLFQI